jgi:hypothetical protein
MLLEFSEVYAGMKCRVDKKWGVKKNRFLDQFSRLIASFSSTCFS